MKETARKFKYNQNELNDYNKIMERRLSISTPLIGTNWNRRDKAPVEDCNMMGEGLGPNMGLDPSKATRWYKEGEYEEIKQEDLRWRAEERALIAERERRYKKLQLSFETKLRDNVEKGKILENQRCFLVYVKGDWEVKSKKYGGLPEGVDIARTDFGHLLICPVVESTEKDAYSDAYGRKFQVDREVRTFIENVFGWVKWTRPLTTVEVNQFGVELI